MGDFKGHPFRGNQWDGHGRTMDVSPSDPGLVLASGTGPRTSKGVLALRARRADQIKGTRTKEEWAAEEAAARQDEQAAVAAGRGAEAKQMALHTAMKRDLAGVQAEAHNADEACGKAWKRWNDARLAERSAQNLPDLGSPEMSQLSPDLRAAAIAYRESQLRTIAATDAKYKAEAAWRDAHQDELNALGDERAKAHTLARAARERVDIARSAQAHYERDQVRAAQTSAAPRAPRNTPATAYNAMSPEASAAIVGAHMTSKLVDGKYRRVPADVNGNAVVIAPNFKATVKDGATFKKNMTAMFPGIIVEGLPRKANAHVLTQIHDEFSALRDEFPEVAVRHVKLNASGSRGVAYAAGDKITIGRNVVESFELAHIGFASGQLREEPRDQPDFHDGTRNGPAYLVRHEFAHQLDFQYPEIRQYFDAEMAKHSGEVNARISVYANKDRWERFAETFAFQKYGDKGTKAHPAMSAMERAIAQWKAKRKVTP